MVCRVIDDGRQRVGEWRGRTERVWPAFLGPRRKRGRSSTGCSPKFGRAPAFPAQFALAGWRRSPATAAGGAARPRQPVAEARWHCRVGRRPTPRYDAASR